MVHVSWIAIPLLFLNKLSFSGNITGYYVFKVDYPYDLITSQRKAFPPNTNTLDSKYEFGGGGHTNIKSIANTMTHWFEEQKLCL